MVEHREIIIPYSPRAEFQSFHDRRQRWAALVCHRRAGKTVASVNDLIRGAIECTNPEPRFAYIAPLFVQAKDIAWSYLKKFTNPIPGVVYNESELRIDLPNKARIRLYGSDNYERLRGIYLDGIILDEYGDMPPAAWGEVIRPCLSDRKGWAVFIGTPKGRNHFWETYDFAEKHPDEWFSLTLRASQTGLIDKAELDDAKTVMTPEQYDQEYECSFQAALLGAYYGKEMTTLEVKKQICNLPEDPSLPVYTAWDLGIDDSTAIWFVQVHASEVRIIDYYENSGCGLDHYAKILKEKDYLYEEHFLPHDAKVKELSSGSSRLDTLDSLGIKNVTVVEMQSIEDGINAVRMMLPRCWFDVKKCARGLEALRQYQREYDEKLKTFKNRPRHDWASHPADAFRYLALGLPSTQYEKYDSPTRSLGGRTWASA